MMRLLFARMTSRLRWSNPRRSARLLLSLARAERASYHDLMAAARACPELTRQAHYLRHALDEQRHARMFSLHAEQLDAAAARDPRALAVDFEQLFERLGETRFLAFVHLGELRGRRQLTLFRDELAARGDGRGRALFDAVLQDEARHEAYTGAELRVRLGSASRVRRALWAARGWELGRDLRRGGRQFAAFLFDVAMRGLYLLLWPLALWIRRRERADRAE